ncbi:Peroxidase 10 [Senna tora]|uniref:Peroxidase n=1 Tax=Senna tora TaxID=362788 RepID=A0A834SU61_9FABA|nr:Peroxidase 10 [Senna tora]
MEYSTSNKHPLFLLFWLVFLSPLVLCQLNYRFYDTSCPNLINIVRSNVWSAMANESRIAASLLRLHFHDCFVIGCDGSVLLDDSSTFKGEKNALPNRNSIRGFEVIDAIKSALEKACPSIVSCADILTLAAREAVYLSGGPFWSVPLGRRDGTSASESEANELPSPFEPLQNITAKFINKGLQVNDVAVLSGAHTFGFAQCFTFKPRLFNFGGSPGKSDPSLDSSFVQILQKLCPNQDDSDNKLAPLDSVTTNRFDNMYYRNLVNNSGLLQSDQALLGDNTTASLVVNYSRYPFLFLRDFAASMEKMGRIGVLTGQQGEIRKNCRVIN